EKLKRRLQARLEMARFLQGTVGEMAKEVKSRRSGEVKRTAEELQKFMKKVNTGGRVTNEEIVAFASLFNDELTLDNMSRPRLVSMCKYMGLQTFGTDAYLRYILRAKLAWIKEDDKMIQSEGVESLSEGELRAACRERGMLGLRSVDDMRKQLRDWLDLALNRSVPSSLLILSRAFLVGSKRPEEAVQATLSSLPAEVVRSVGATVPSDDEAETSARLLKLKLIKEQERLIEEEAQEAARLQLAGGRDLAREEMREALPTPAAATTTTTTAAAAAAPAAGMAGEGAGAAAVERAAVEGEEARALAERKALAKKDQLCDLSAALAVLASSSSVAKERADFLRLVNKEIELYNSMVQQHGTEGAEELRVAYAAAREASEKEASEAAASDVSDALISKVDSMLHKLEKELDSADAKIGKRLKTLDTDYDGKVSPEEVGAAAALLRDSLGQEGLEELISNLAKDADGKILVEDIVKLGAHAQASMDRDDDVDSEVQGGIKGSTVGSSGSGSPAMAAVTSSSISTRAASTVISTAQASDRKDRQAAARACLAAGRSFAGRELSRRYSPLTCKPAQRPFRMRVSAASAEAEAAAAEAGKFIPAAPILLPEGPWKEVEGGVVAAKGFKAYGKYAALRAAGQKPDLSLVLADSDATVAAAFTQNVVAAAPVLYCKKALQATSTARAVIANAGQANAATGDAGYADTVECAESLAKLLGVSAESVLVQSTGVIGQRIKKAPLIDALPSLVESASSTPEAGLAAAVAITTTDLVSKSVAIETQIGSTTVRLGGMAKGSGMIHPNMATMLGVVTCDAAVAPDLWKHVVLTAVQRSFNQITVDGDTSTNDCVIALASGKAGGAVIADSASEEGRQLQAAMDAVCQGLAKAIAWDGEGATCLIEVHVAGATTEADAAVVARSVAASSLAKAAVYGRDPNWGRIACAAGYAGVPFEPTALRIALGDILLMDKGQPLPFDRKAASEYLRGKGEVHGTVIIDISIGDGPGDSKA
ncbi:unnamed protein product, partial [Closterium sp. Naga37s-1]